MMQPEPSNPEIVLSDTSSPQPDNEVEPISVSGDPSPPQFPTRQARVSLGIENLIGDSESKTNLKSKKESTVEFSKLLHVPEAVTKQLDVGLLYSSRLIKLFKDIIELQNDFAKNSKERISKELKWLSNQDHSNTDKMNGAFQFLRDILDNRDSSSNALLAMSNEMKLSILEPLTQLHSISEKKNKDIHSGVKKTKDTLSKGLHYLEKSKKDGQEKLNKLNDQYQKKKQEMENPDAPKGMSMTGYASKLIGLKEKTREEKVSEAYAAASDSLLVYTEALLSANHYRDTYYSSDSPQLLISAQSVEEMRLHQLKSLMTSFQSMQLRTADTLRRIADDFSASIEDFRIDDNIEQFVQGQLEKSPQTTIEPLSYELPKTSEQLKTEYFAQKAGGPIPKSEIADSSIFHCSIEDVIQREKNQEIIGIPPISDVVETVNIPKIVYALVSNIESLGGINSVGIFRINPDEVRMTELREQFGRGNYSFKPNEDPNLPASLLKYWLRNLEPSLFSSEIYYRVIEAGQTMHANQLNHSLSQLNNQLALEVYSLLPEVNKKIISTIFELLKKVLMQKEKNKMNLHALAVVFTPAFIRSPSSDPKEVLKHVHDEVNFLQYLISALTEFPIERDSHDPIHSANVTEIQKPDTKKEEPEESNLISVFETT